MRVRLLAKLSTSQTRKRKSPLIPADERVHIQIFLSYEIDQVPIDGEYVKHGQDI